MAPESNKQDQTHKEQVRQVAAAAMEEVLDKSTLDALLNVRDEDLVSPDPEREALKGTANRSGGWYHAPAHLEIFAAADRRLTKTSTLAGMPTKRVERVQAKLIKGTKLIVIKPAPADDLTAIPINRYNGQSTAWINLFSLTGPIGLTVETGYRELYDLAYIPRESPLWPGLVMDLGQPRERRQEPVPKKRAKTPT